MKPPLSLSSPPLAASAASVLFGDSETGKKKKIGIQNHPLLLLCWPFNPFGSLSPLCDTRYSGWGGKAVMPRKDYELSEYQDSLNPSLTRRLTEFVKELNIDKGRPFFSSSQGRGVTFPHFWNRVIIPKQTGKYRLWVNFVLLWAIYSSFFTPLEFAFFRGLPHNFEWIDQVGQVVFLIDIVVTFLVAYRDMRTYRWVEDHRSIALRYAKTSLVPDLLGCLPWDIIYKAAGRKEGIRYLLWVRLYRARKVEAFLQSLEKNIRINYMFTRIAKLITVELYCTHTAACIFYYLATTLRPSEEKFTWIGSLSLGDYNYENFREIDLGRLYVTSLYWAVVTMATVGYGDIHAVNVREMIFVMIFVSFDMILGAYLLGNMTALIVKGSNTERFRDKMTALIKYMNRHALGRDLRSQMKSHLQLQYESKFTENGILEALPSSIRSKVSQSLYVDIVEKVLLFQNCSQEFYNQIVTRVSEEFFLPGEVIMEQGDAVDQLYIICSGSLDEVVMNVDGSEENIANLETLNVFGEVALLCNIPQPYTVRVCELCKLLRIDKQSFLNLLQVYFIDGRQILNNILKNKDTDTRIRQLESDISFFITREEEIQALKVNLAAYHGNYTQLYSYVKAGADINKTDYSGRSPLHLAAAKGHEQIVQFLVKEGSNVNCKDNAGATPLHEAIKGGHDHVAALLIEAGGQLLLENPSFHLQHAVKSGKLEYLRRLLRNKVDPNSKDYHDRTALHLAAAEGSHLFANELITYGANIHQPDRWKKTPLDEAKHCGSKNRVYTFFESICGEGDANFDSIGSSSRQENSATNQDLKSQNLDKEREAGAENLIFGSSGGGGEGNGKRKKRCTAFSSYPNEFQKRGLALWVPPDLKTLLQTVSHHFGSTFTYVLNHDCGEILSTDLIQDGDKIFLISEEDS